MYVHVCVHVRKEEERRKKSKSRGKDKDKDKSNNYKDNYKGDKSEIESGKEKSRLLSGEDVDGFSPIERWIAKHGLKVDCIIYASQYTIYALLYAYVLLFLFSIKTNDRLIA